MAEILNETCTFHANYEPLDLDEYLLFSPGFLLARIRSCGLGIEGRVETQIPPLGLL